MLTNVKVWIDGSCLGNPGPGGWGAVIVCDTGTEEISGGEPLSKNNRMELMAAISTLEHLVSPHRVEFFTDSTYVQGAIRGFKKPKENLDLLEHLKKARVPHQVDCILVKGHSGNCNNQRADRLAIAEAKKQKAM